MQSSLITPHVRVRGAALQHVVSPTTWRDALRLDFSRTSVAAPLRVGVAVGVVLVVGALLGLRDLAGLAALGALVSAFCRPDPYPVRAPRLIALGVGVTAVIAVGATMGTYANSIVTEIVVTAVLAGIACYVVSALRIVGPGAVIFVFAATGAAGYAHSAADIGRATLASAIGAVIGILIALAPWFVELLRSRLPKSRTHDDTSKTAPAQRESIWVTLAGGQAPAHRKHLAVTAIRIAIAAAIAATIAVAIHLDHPMWAAMGAVAAMQGVEYHLTVRRGVQRLLGNLGGAVIAGILLAVPLGYWGAVAGIVIFQVLAEILSTVNYALCSLAVTPMALLLTGLSAGLSPEAAVDRVLDTAIGIVVGIVVATLAVRGHDIAALRGHAANAPAPENSDTELSQPNSAPNRSRS